MTLEKELEYTDEVLNIIENRDNFTTSDLQSVVQVLVKEIMTGDFRGGLVFDTKVKEPEGYADGSVETIEDKAITDAYLKGTK